MKAFLFGLGFGIGFGVLFAQISGEQMRENLAHGSETSELAGRGLPIAHHSDSAPEEP